MSKIETLVDGLDHPEGVAWDPEASVLWTGGEDGQLYRVDVEARTWELAARASGFVLGLAVDGRGQHDSAEIVDVLADEVHPAGSLPTPPFRLHEAPRRCPRRARRG